MFRKFTVFHRLVKVAVGVKQSILFLQGCTLPYGNSWPAGRPNGLPFFCKIRAMR